MIEIAIAFVLGILTGLIIYDRIGECLWRREIKRLKARSDAPRPLTLQERRAALEPEMRLGQGAQNAEHGSSG